jgi:hypothetical protein
MEREFRMFGCTIVGIEGGAQIEANHGCDGNIHVDCINKVWVDACDAVTFAVHLGVEERGFCPNRVSGKECIGWEDATGFFSYTY